MSDYWVYYGNASGGAGEGIYEQSLAVDSMEVSVVERVAEAAFAGFQVVDGEGAFLYSIALKEGAGWVESYRIDRATGGLTRVDAAKAGGGKLCYLGLDRSGEWALGVSYSDAVVSILPVKGEGMLGELTFSMAREGGSKVVESRQGEAHAHSIYADPTNKYLLVCDLGNDEICIGKFDAESGLIDAGSMRTVATVPGAGPRHLAFHPNGKWVYVINELNGTITHYGWEGSEGRLDPKETVATLPNDYSEENTTAEIVVSADGRFVYGSNRGHDSLVVYAVCEATGKLSLIQTESTRGGHPRHFNISPCGRVLLVANRDSDAIESFRIDEATGKLAYVKQVAKVPTPICIRFVAKD